VPPQFADQPRAVANPGRQPISVAPPRGAARPAAHKNLLKQKRDRDSQRSHSWLRRSASWHLAGAAPAHKNLLKQRRDRDS
jgi:hypothetical protein